MSAPTRNFIISFFQALEQIHLLWLLLAEKYVTGCFYVCFCFYPSLLQLIFPSGVTKATTNIFFSRQKIVIRFTRVNKTGCFFSLTWLGNSDFIYNHIFQHLCLQYIFLHFYSLQELFKQSHSNDIIISLYFKSSISIITYLRTN